MLYKFLLAALIAVNLVYGNPLQPARIVNGENAVEGQFPYMISIRAFPGMGLVCGGAIVSEHWTLTASHCIATAVPVSTRIVGGSVFLNGGPNTVIHAADRILLHPDYIQNVIANDVGLIRVINPFVWSRYVQPIRVGSEFVGGGLPAQAMGWGWTSSNGQGGVPNNLQWMSTETLSHSTCTGWMGGWIRESHLCSFRNGGIGVCMGDSGGPLVVGNAVVGTSSFIVPCATTNPDGWERVSVHYSWISTNIVN